MVASIGVHFFFEMSNFVFILIPLNFQDFLVFGHFGHKVIFLFREVELWVFPFDEVVDILFELIDVDLVLLLSFLILVHEIVPRCQTAFVLFNGFFQKSNFLCDIDDDVIFGIDYLLQFNVFFL